MSDILKREAKNVMEAGDNEWVEIVDYFYSCISFYEKKKNCNIPKDYYTNRDKYEIRYKLANEGYEYPIKYVENKISGIPIYTRKLRNDYIPYEKEVSSKPDYYTLFGFLIVLGFLCIGIYKIFL